MSKEILKEEECGTHSTNSQDMGAVKDINLVQRGESLCPPSLGADF